MCHSFALKHSKQSAELAVKMEYSFNNQLQMQPNEFLSIKDMTSEVIILENYYSP